MLVHEAAISTGTAFKAVRRHSLFFKTAHMAHLHTQLAPILFRHSLLSQNL